MKSKNIQKRKTKIKLLKQKNRKLLNKCVIKIKQK